ncbi:MAG: fluoride efflux transporter CrcB [Polyangia bacterium]
MKNALLVALGGALGALARYGVASALKRFGSGFPFATLLINVTGCAVIGFFLAAVNGRWSGIHAGWSYLVPIGFVGAYTTFSTYEYEMARLLEVGAFARLAAYFVLSNGVGFAAVVGGIWLGRRA